MLHENDRLSREQVLNPSEELLDTIAAAVVDKDSVRAKLAWKYPCLPSERIDQLAETPLEPSRADLGVLVNASALYFFDPYLVEEDCEPTVSDVIESVEVAPEGDRATGFAVLLTEDLAREDREAWASTQSPSVVKIADILDRVYGRVSWHRPLAIKLDEVRDNEGDLRHTIWISHSGGSTARAVAQEIAGLG